MREKWQPIFHFLYLSYYSHLYFFFLSINICLLYIYISSVKEVGSCDSVHVSEG